jgi:hypothetical protein
VHESMSEASRNRGIHNMFRGSEGIYEEEWDYDCGMFGCDKGDDDVQLEYLEGEWDE